MHIASGSVQERDHFIISTQRLLRTITPAQLAQIAQHSGDGVVQGILSKLTAEKEVACLCHIHVLGGPELPFERRQGVAARPAVAARTRTKVDSRKLLSSVMDKVGSVDWSGFIKKFSAKKGKGNQVNDFLRTLQERLRQFFSDLYDPERKRRAHLLLLAGSGVVFLLIWMTIQLSLSSQRNQTRDELASLVKQINADISTADSRQLAGDTESANAILQRAEDRARQVMSNDSRLFEKEALDLLGIIKSKREEMNRVFRIVAPSPVAHLDAKKSDVQAQGLIGYPNGEFIVYDRQNLFRISLSTVELLEKLGTEELILDATDFSRFQSKVFLATGNSVVELIGDQPQTMKTEDPAGWVTGTDIKTYLRYLYILSPERKQIYKYERLSTKYGPPSEYNVNGDLSGALDMTIVGPVYVLRDVSGDAKNGKRDVVKLLRGEKQTFAIRNLPPGALDGTTKIFKSAPNGNFYFLDPIGKRVIVTTNDGDLGDSLYLKQYILDSDQVGTLKDLYVDPDDSHLYVLDEKKLYAIDLQRH
jgi:hypothetical protein